MPWAVSQSFLPAVMSNLYCKENKSQGFPGVWWACCWWVATSVCDDDDCICCSTLDVGVTLHHPRQRDMAATPLTSQEINVLMENIELSGFQVLGCPESTRGFSDLWIATILCPFVWLVIAANWLKICTDTFLDPHSCQWTFHPRVPIFCVLLSSTKAGGKIYCRILAASETFWGVMNCGCCKSGSVLGQVPQSSVWHGLWDTFGEWRLGSIHQSGSLLSVSQRRAEGISNSLAMGVWQRLCMDLAMVSGAGLRQPCPLLQASDPLCVFSFCGLLHLALPHAQTKALYLGLCCTEEPPGNPQLPLSEALTLQLYVRPAFLGDSTWGSQPLLSQAIHFLHQMGLLLWRCHHCNKNTLTKSSLGMKGFILAHSSWGIRVHYGEEGIMGRSVKLADHIFIHTEIWTGSGARL